MDLTFRLATARDVPEMMALWRHCFPEDEESFIQRFFATIPAEYAAVACKANILAMSFLLPAEVRLAGERYPVRYLYAGCTHPSFRGQGIYTRLLQFASAFSADNGDCAIYLHPATPSLATYYERCGYRPGIGGWRTASAPAAKSIAVTTALSAAGYLSKRSRLLPHDRPVWQLVPPADTFFVELMLEDGWQPFADARCCGLLSPDGSQVYDAIAATPVLPSFGIDLAGVWEDTAWWIPTSSENVLTDIMRNKTAYTAFLGDI